MSMKTTVEIIRQFDTTDKCVAYLESVRWKNGVKCPFCGSEKTCAKAEKSMRNRQQCWRCRKSFSVASGTIFDRARKLPEWFQILALMLNAKKSLSSYQISRDLGLRQGTAWKIQNKIRQAMQTEESELLQGLIEMDETCIGGKGRRIIGRGTDKTPVVGMAKRGGQIGREAVTDKALSFRTLEDIVKRNIGKLESILITDEYRGYRPMGSRGGIAHAIVNRRQAYVEGFRHANTLEGFRSPVKRAWYGSHRHYSRANIHLYVGETSV